MPINTAAPATNNILEDTTVDPLSAPGPEQG